MNSKQIRFLLIAGMATLLTFTASTASATLYYDPVVTVVGSGSALSSAGVTTAISIYQHSVASQASPISTTAFNGTPAGFRLVTSGTSTSEGTLTNNPAVSDAAAKGVSYVGTQYVYNAGYDAPNGTPAVAGATAAAPRSFGQTNVTNVTATGATVLQTQTNATAYTSVSIRGAVGDDTGTALYSAGASPSTASLGGWRNFSTNSILASTPTNVRTVELLGGNLLGTTGSGTVGIYSIDATGAGAASPATLYLGTGTGASPYEFALFDDPNLNGIGSTLNLGFDTAYVADDRGSAAGGIQKYTWNGTVWTLAYTLKDAGLTTPAYRGLAGQIDPNTNLITLFTSVQDTTTSKLQQVTDTGAASGFTTLASLTTSTGFVFRGVALATIPEPTAFLFGGLVCGVIGLAAGSRRIAGKLRNRDSA